MYLNSMKAAIQCDDHVEMLLFERFVWDKDDEYLAFSIMDSYIGSGEYQGLLGRLRRTWHAFFTKPICHAGIVVMEPERARMFLNDCLAILAAEAGEQPND